ncbi:MAG TPA: copper uptake system-associated protein [Devosia sp.]|jgi:hypothetical protein|uniref:copper uptake system-associated protein n=1 Tax=Devosia sp. TaxID=1871048 RepID=UPI002DDC9413|nr:copper uptake system-associated protein [Devosia sp.]HEV2516281.1 copper uptake system-associated protein [Devosia sp.]
MKTFRSAFVALALLGSGLAAATHASIAVAAEVTVGDLVIGGGFTRATLPNAPVGGGYLTITNKGSQADRLLSAASPVAGVTQIHEMKMEGDVMKMKELPDGIEVPAGSTVTLSPGGLHIMFMQLKQALVEGTNVPLTLTFEKAGVVEVQLDVGGIGADAPTTHHSEHSPASGHGAHASHAASQQTGLSDIDAIAAMQKQMFDKPDNPLAMGAIVVVGDYAVSGWAQGDTGGRALLRRTANGWGIHLCAGDGLKDAAELVRLGVPEDVSQQLASRLASAEASLDPALVAKFSTFDGVMMVDENLL